MHYAFEIKQVCGGYAYFSAFTHGMNSVSRRYERRAPSLVDFELFGKALKDLRLPLTTVDSSKTYGSWLKLHGWALVEAKFARSTISQWLKEHDYVKSPLGSFTDVTIASPSVLKRNLRGRAKDAILERDGGKCLLCGAADDLTLQHVLPYSLGGESHSGNLVALCEPCNQKLRDEYHIELYELAGIQHGIEPALLKQSNLSDRAMARAVQFSHNLMHSRCDVW
jgi:hypothetical protein